MPMLSMKTKNPMKPMFEILAITDDAGLSSPATVLQVVWRSIWQFLDAILLATWWLGIGRLLDQDHLRLSRPSLVLAGPRQPVAPPTSPG